MKRVGSGIVASVLCIAIVLAPLTVSAAGPLVLGVFPRRAAVNTMTMFQPMATYLGRQLGREVKLVTAKDFEAFMAGVKNGEYDVVHLNQYQYVKAHKALGYDVIAMNEELGSRTLAGTIVVRKDSGIKTLADLRGKKIVFGGGPTAMMSYVVPTYLLRKAGLNKGEYQEEFGKSPPNAALAVFYKQAAAGGTGDIAVTVKAVAGQVNTDELTFIAQSEPFAQLPWAVKKGMDPELRGKVRDALVGLAKTAEGREILKAAELTGLHPAEDKDYDSARAVVEAVLAEKY